MQLCSRSVLVLLAVYCASGPALGATASTLPGLSGKALMVELQKAIQAQLQG